MSLRLDAVIHNLLLERASQIKECGNETRTYRLEIGRLKMLQTRREDGTFCNSIEYSGCKVYIARTSDGTVFKNDIFVHGEWTDAITKEHLSPKQALFNFNRKY